MGRRMLGRLSSKGQIVIPKAVPGTELQVEVVEQKVVLEPVTSGSPIDALYGKYAEYDLLSALEQEHQSYCRVWQPRKTCKPSSK